MARQQAHKAERAGFTCQRTGDLAEALACLGGSQQRQGFAYGMTLDGLELAARLMGPEALRVYSCRASSGQPATARVILHRPGARALDWMAGTRDEQLRSGATQQLLAFALEDLHRAGATAYDSCGADLEGVACAKLAWGGRLVPQYSVQGWDWLPARRLLGAGLRFLRQRAAVRRARRAAPDAPSPPIRPAKSETPCGSRCFPEASSRATSRRAGRPCSGPCPAWPARTSLPASRRPWPPCVRT